MITVLHFLILVLSLDAYTYYKCTFWDWHCKAAIHVNVFALAHAMYCTCLKENKFYIKKQSEDVNCDKGSKRLRSDSIFSTMFFPFLFCFGIYFAAGAAL